MVESFKNSTDKDESVSKGAQGDILRLVHGCTDNRATCNCCVGNMHFTREQYTSASDIMQGQQNSPDLDYEASGV